jgi:DNA-binding MarR family transcriptional regulator
VDQPPEPLVYDAVEAIYNVVEQADEDIDAFLAELTLTRPLSDAVWVMYPQEPAITMRELATRLRCEPSTATFLVDKLVDKGLVERGSDPRDRRRTTVALTPAGLDTRVRLTKAMTNASPLANLSVADLTVLLGLLQKALADAPLKYRM